MGLRRPTPVALVDLFKREARACLDRAEPNGVPARLSMRCGAPPGVREGLRPVALALASAGSCPMRRWSACMLLLTRCS